MGVRTTGGVGLFSTCVEVIPVEIRSALSYGILHVCGGYPAWLTPSNG